MTTGGAAAPLRPTRERPAGTVPIGRVGSTDEIVAAVLWPASDESAFVVGHDLVVDGGVTA
ncbi:SDR family oxidoreductase [Streptomyces sp. DT24]|uniref:SDR family oxidoreductase n=1 Tax=Streptomyces sp. DT24 TaxID=3416520 RepID=UPI003CECC87D